MCSLILRMFKLLFFLVLKCFDFKYKSIKRYLVLSVSVTNLIIWSFNQEACLMNCLETKHFVFVMCIIMTFSALWLIYRRQFPLLDYFNQSDKGWTDMWPAFIYKSQIVICYLNFMMSNNVPRRLLSFLHLTKIHYK